ncbi:MAG: hypothetical protein A3D92_12615 [Bacteroidetes bacterium RIFCSPHIGHO2_02_FULL_44_7]|nr:MAG: hypothetical protein A3D92_12615 [Bacteroidetes bacterium RIFCSPHIGHO2_02_FULL_44_7]
MFVSLYVDEDVELPKNEQKVVTVEGHKMNIVTVGDKWRLAEIEMYNITAQPYYRILTADAKDINEIGAATYETHSTAEKFRKWLEDGLKLSK